VSPRVRLAALAITLAGLLAFFAISGSLSPDKVRDWLDGYGAAGPLIFIAVSACLTVAMFPGPLLSGASGLLFGTALGTPVSIVAATLGASLAFCVSRWWAHDAVEEIAGPRIRGLKEFVGRRGFISVLYARMAPGVPYNLVNYAAGTTGMPLRVFAGATAIGVTPRAFAYTALGGQFGNFSAWQTLVAVSVLLVMGIVGLVVAHRDPEIGPLLRRVTERAAGRPDGGGAAASPRPAPEASAPGTGSSSPGGRSADPR
jgi:uncharacterized membrane protein YdjX (TVP38/TMEM64 family)